MNMSSPPPQDFSARLRHAREMRKLSQAELAKKTGLQPSAIAHFEGERRKPSFDNVRVLAKALDVSADYLYGTNGATTAFKNEDKLSSEDRKYVQLIIDTMLKQKGSSE